jgi:type IV pilus assembly protein PilB
MSDPLNVIAVDELRMITNTEFDINVATASDVRRALMNFYKVQGSLKSAIDEYEASSEDFATSITGAGLAQDVAGVSADDAPVVRLVSNILEQAVKDQVSDVHIEVYEKVSKVRNRVDGALFEYIEYPASLHPAVISRLKIIAGMDISERRKPQDGRIIVKVLDKRIDLRVNTLPTIYGEKVVMRLLDQSTSKVGLTNLGLFEDDISVLHRNIAAPHGILTGPTGSGKSTTLASMVSRINKTKNCHILTIEDPIEYLHRHNKSIINQREVGDDTLTFANAIRAAPGRNINRRDARHRNDRHRPDRRRNRPFTALDAAHDGRVEHDRQDRGYIPGRAAAANTHSVIHDAPRRYIAGISPHDGQRPCGGV